MPAGSHSGLGRDNATRHLPRNAPAGGNPASPHNPKELSASARSRSDSRRTGQNRLTWQRCARRRRTRQRTLPSIAPSHVSQWSTHGRTHRHRRTRRSTHRHRRTRRSTHRHRSTHRSTRRSTHRHRRTRRSTHRSTHRHRRTRWSTHRHRRTRRSTHRSTHRHWRTRRSTHRHRRTRWSTHRQGPRRSQRNTGHLSDRSASGTAHIRSYRPSDDDRRGSVARRRLHAGVAARYERGGSRVRAQRHGGCAQSSAGNHFHVEPIGDLHQRQLPYPRSSRTA